LALEEGRAYLVVTIAEAMPAPMPLDLRPLRGLREREREEERE
jgi:hypothetical protein